MASSFGSQGIDSRRQNGCQNNVVDDRYENDEDQVARFDTGESAGGGSLVERWLDYDQERYGAKLVELLLDGNCLCRVRKYSLNDLTDYLQSR